MFPTSQKMAPYRALPVILHRAVEQLAAAQMQHMTVVAHHTFDVVGHHNHRDPQFFIHRLYQLIKPPRSHRVEARGRLIQ